MPPGEASGPVCAESVRVILVMGIDPGVANTGFGVVRIAGGQMTAVDGGVVESQRTPRSTAGSRPSTPSSRS